MSTVIASTASLEREFQSLMVQGKKEPPLQCSGGDEAKLLTVGAPISQGGGRTSLVVLMGHWTSPL